MSQTMRGVLLLEDSSMQQPEEWSVPMTCHGQASFRCVLDSVILEWSCTEEKEDVRFLLN